MQNCPLPPFPDDIPTHPLTVVDYELLKGGDDHEIRKLWKAATELGFWYLKNHGVDHEVDEMFKMGDDTMNLAAEEKMKFEPSDNGVTFGYIRAGGRSTDAYSNLDTVEFINISKDDALAFPKIINRSYPTTVNDKMVSTVRPFIRKAFEVNSTLLSVFEKKLSLPAGILVEFHKIEKESNCEARCIKKPPEVTHTETSTSQEKVAIGAHTDFGSLTFLHNRLGGLQVLPPGETEWQHVLPIPGHAICNIGDALTIFSGGILHSNLHRVVPPPGPQSLYTRWSLVYFTRPNNAVPLRALSDKSAIIGGKIDQMSTEERAKYEMDVTALQWFSNRSKSFRSKESKSEQSVGA